jgi:PIN domain nuclease of toxin-antitoxin system
MGISVNIGDANLNMPAFDEIVRDLDHQPLDLDYGIQTYAESLPLHHADPFDRMIIAQALRHNHMLAASDDHIRRYDVPLLW